MTKRQLVILTGLASLVTGAGAHFAGYHVSWGDVALMTWFSGFLAAALL
jgi:hypothetical protein